MKPTTEDRRLARLAMEDAEGELSLPHNVLSLKEIMVKHAALALAKERERVDEVVRQLEELRREEEARGEEDRYPDDQNFPPGP